MMLKKRGLGRGLSTLLSEAVVEAVVEPVTTLALTQLVAGQFQPRRHFARESLTELAQSIRVHGVMQPIVVRQLTQSRYEIIAGERRFRAAKLAELTEIPVVIREISDEAALAMALIENIQREDLHPLEQAQALQQLQQQFKLTHEQIATQVGKSRVAVTHLLRLLTLPASIQQYLQVGKIELGHAKLLAGLILPMQITLAQQIVAKHLSVRETEQLIQQMTTSAILIPKKVDPNIQSLQRELAEKLGTAVTIRHQSQGKGKLIIHYRNVDILEGVLGRMNLKN